MLDQRRCADDFDRLMNGQYRQSSENQTVELHVGPKTGDISGFACRESGFAGMHNPPPPQVRAEDRQDVRLPFD